MSLLNVAKTDETIENETDSVGSSGPLESGLYPFSISLAYLMKSKGGAVGLNLHMKTDSGQEVREVLWIASGDAKGNKNFYMNQNGEKKYLPGFNNANSLSLLTVGKELAELNTEEKVVNVYSPEAKAEVPTKVEMIMDLLNQRAIVGLQKQIVDKNVKDANGAYVASGDTREVNEIDKFFREADQLTTAEIRAGGTEPAFYNTWDQKFTGKTRNRASAASGNGGTAGAPQTVANAGPAANGAAPAAGSKPTASLFG